MAWETEPSQRSFTSSECTFFCWKHVSFHLVLWGQVSSSTSSINWKLICAWLSYPLPSISRSTNPSPFQVICGNFQSKSLQAKQAQRKSSCTYFANSCSSTLPIISFVRSLLSIMLASSRSMFTFYNSCFTWLSLEQWSQFSSCLLPPCFTRSPSHLIHTKSDFQMTHSTSLFDSDPNSDLGVPSLQPSGVGSVCIVQAERHLSLSLSSKTLVMRSSPLGCSSLTSPQVYLLSELVRKALSQP